MVGNRKFQLKSLVRQAAVKYFTFGFVKRTDADEHPMLKTGKYDGEMKYLVHHLKNDHQSIDEQTISSQAEKQGIVLYFFGTKSARLGGKREGELKNAPFLMDSIILFEADNATSFDELISSELYQEFIDQNESNYIGLFGREF